MTDTTIGAERAPVTCPMHTTGHPDCDTCPPTHVLSGGNATTPAGVPGAGSSRFFLGNSVDHTPPPYGWDHQ